MKKSTNEAIKWLNANAGKHPEWLNEDFYFDWPDYAGMPKKILNRVSDQALDAIACSWPNKKWDGRVFRREVEAEGSDI